MSQKTVFFDLDGTLTDSGEGIMNCAELAIRHFHLPVPPLSVMKSFVGPPLRDSFLRVGVKEEDVEEAVAVFRSRYTTVGIYENHPYPGVEKMLQTLKSRGHTLYVATSKPEPMALEVLRHFGLRSYFDLVCGATLDGSRDTKSDVITYLLKTVSKTDATLMVGDTEFDVLGAASHGIPTIGVTWGYGSEASIARAGAVSIAHTMDELVELIEK